MAHAGSSCECGGKFAIIPPDYANLRCDTCGSPVPGRTVSDFDKSSLSHKERLLANVDAEISRDVEMMVRNVIDPLIRKAMKMNTNHVSIGHEILLENNIITTGLVKDGRYWRHCQITRIGATLLDNLRKGELGAHIYATWTSKTGKTTETKDCEFTHARDAWTCDYSSIHLTIWW